MPSATAIIHSVLLLLTPAIMAQSIGPSNDDLPSQVDSLILNYVSGGMTNSVTVFPLTAQIGLGQSQTALNNIKIQGSIRPADAHTTSYIASSNIAYISCDPNGNSSNITPSSVVESVIQNTPQAVLLYSQTASHCALNGSYSYNSILTMTTISDSKILLGVIDTATNPPTGVIQDKTMASGNQTTSAGTPAPTTAVAMSILYSITGIITLLFVVIIATGALRAHRHPERYGPRNIAGRPRQSRAKGIARAMLETLPIIKFGDPDPPKPGSAADPGDIELESGVTDPRTKKAVDAAEGEKPEDVATLAPVVAAIDTVTEEEGAGSGLGPNIQSTPATVSREDLAAEAEHLGCSICTEDFEKGEDVRVLPCNHKYHPACVDPWLLNVSGTCPLCRVDLNTGATTEVPAESVDGPLSPPLNDPEHAGSVDATGTQAADLHTLRNAPASERIAALRELAAQTSNTPAPDNTAEQSRRAKITSRLREKFRVRTQPTEVIDVRQGSASQYARHDSVFNPGGSLGISAMPLPIYIDPARNNSATTGEQAAGSVSGTTNT